MHRAEHATVSWPKRHRQNKGALDYRDHENHNFQIPSNPVCVWTRRKINPLKADNYRSSHSDGWRQIATGQSTTFRDRSGTMHIACCWHGRNWGVWMWCSTCVHITTKTLARCVDYNSDDVESRFVWWGIKFPHSPRRDASRSYQLI